MDFDFGHLVDVFASGGKRRHIPLTERWLQDYGWALKEAGRRCCLGRWVWRPEPWDPLSDEASCWSSAPGQLLLFVGELVGERAGAAGLRARPPRRQLLFAGVRSVEHMCAVGERRFMAWPEAQRAWPRLQRERGAKGE